MGKAEERSERKGDDSEIRVCGGGWGVFNLGQRDNLKVKSLGS